MNKTLQAFILVALFSGCPGEDTETYARKAPKLSIKRGMSMSDVNRALIGCGARDWTANCSYMVAGAGPVRYYDLPNGILLDVLCDSKTTAPDGGNIVSGLRVQNSRMLRSVKGEIIYDVDAIEWRSVHEMELNPNPRDDDRNNAWVYVNQASDEADRALKKADVRALGADDASLKKSLDELNATRDQGGFKAVGVLTAKGDWRRYAIRKDVILCVQVIDDVKAKEAFVNAMFCVFEAKRPWMNLHEIEYEMIDLRDPRLSQADR